MTRTGADYVALVLAAGASRRMGADQNKLLEEVGGRPLVAGVVEAFVEAGVDRVLVVVGHEAERIEAVLAGRPGVEWVANAAWSEGMGSSLAAGASALAKEAAGRLDGVLVCVGDLPGLSPEVIGQVCAAHAESASPAAICVPTHGGRDGHPVLFGRVHLDALVAQSGDRGARGLLLEYADDVRRVPVESAGIFEDVDTPEQLERARREVGSR